MIRCSSISRGMNASPQLLIMGSPFTCLFSSSTSISFMFGPAFHCFIKTIFTPRFPVHCTYHFFYFSTFCTSDFMFILLIHTSAAVGAVVPRLHIITTNTTNAAITPYHILLQEIQSPMPHLRNVSGGKI